PFAVPLCSSTAFEGGPPPASPLRAAGLYEAPTAECAKSVIGWQEATIFTGKFGEGGAGDVPVGGVTKGRVYDLETSESETMRPGGPHLASLYGVAVELPKFLTE